MIYKRICFREEETHMPDLVKTAETGYLDKILEEIAGAVPDTGKTLEEYRGERIRERYGVPIPVPASCDAAG